MMEVFDGVLYVSVLILIDGVLQFSKTLEDYLQVLKQSFERFQKLNVKLNPTRHIYVLVKSLGWKEDL